MWRWLRGKHQIPELSPVDAFLRRFRREHEETSSQRREREHHAHLKRLRDQASAQEGPMRDVWTDTP